VFRQREYPGRVRGASVQKKVLTKKVKHKKRSGFSFVGFGLLVRTRQIHVQQ